MIFFAERQGRCSQNLCFYLSENHWRDLTFAFVFEGVLFEFAYAKPAFELLFALPLNRTPQEQPTFIHPLLQIVPCSRCPHRYPSREFVHFPNLGEDIFDFPRIGEELACIAVVIVPIHLDLDERPILSELRFHSLDVVADPKGEVNFCCVVSGQLKCLLVSSAGIFRKSSEPSSSIGLWLFSIVVSFNYWPSVFSVALSVMRG